MFFAYSLFASGGPGPSGSSTPQVSLHVPNEMAPPGGVVQMKFMVTEPTPISTGGPVVSLDAAMFDSVWGIELFCAAGDVNGIAMINSSRLNILYSTTAGAQGTDYPIMTMALHIRPDAVPGTQSLFQLDPSSWWNLGSLGTATLKPVAPATVTVGGSISITNVVPGGGLLPAGTVISIRGIGFQPKSQVQLNAIKFSSIQWVSPEEIRFTLAAPTNMTGQKIQVVNPDGSQDTYFSYLRGVPLAASTQPLLAYAVPIFSSVTHSWAAFSSMATGSSSQFAGLALQNPNLAPAVVTVSLYSSGNALLGSSTITLPAGYRVMQDIAQLTGGAAPVFGSYAVVSSSEPLQMLGFAGDNSTGTITPFAAALAQP